MSLCRTRGVGQYQTSEPHSFLWERNYRTSARGVIGVGGRTSTDILVVDGTDASFWRSIPAAGFPMAVPSTGTTWGNDAIRTKLTNLRSYSISNFGWDSDKVFLVGGSMGGLSCLSWAIANATLVAGIVLLVPAVNLTYMHTANIGGWATEMETAYGGLAAFNSAMATHDPMLNAATLSAIPMKIWYSTDDPYIRPADCTAFAAATGAEIVSLGAVSHTITGLNTDQVLDFLAEHDE